MPIHPLWIVALLVIVLIVFGPGRLPELGGAIGKSLREFRKATSDIREEVTKGMSGEEQSTTTQASSTPPPPSTPSASTATPEPPKKVEKTS